MAPNQDVRALCEGIETPDRRAEAVRLVGKWERTGLLEGLDKHNKSNMARLLENQAAELLKESSSVADIAGFQNVAFPIVRRVFGGLIANELVSVQPMSLPSGLLFYLDYRYDSVKASNRSDSFAAGASLFGNQNSLADAAATGGMYGLLNGFSQREKVCSTTLLWRTIGTVALSDITYDPELSASATLQKLTVTNGYSTLTALADAQTDLGAIKQWSSRSLDRPPSPAPPPTELPVQLGGLKRLPPSHQGSAATISCSSSTTLSLEPPALKASS
jgi:hypothetical protein